MVSFSVLDINECEDLKAISCYGSCKNTPGSYDCTCPPGSFGIATTENGCHQYTKDSKFSSNTFIIGNSSCSSFHVHRNTNMCMFNTYIIYVPRLETLSKPTFFEINIVVAILSKQR